MMVGGGIVLNSVLRRRVLFHKVAQCRRSTKFQVNSIAMGAQFTKSYSVNKGQGSSSKSSCDTTCKSDPNNHYIESTICNVQDINDNEMKVFDMGEDGKVLLVKQNGELSAIGHKCTHYGAPLVNGALGDGRVRCPWHGACFNIKTGDIEDFPGFDSLPCYKVTIGKKGEVKVRAKVSDLKASKRVKEVCPGGAGCDDATVVIVGAGPAGATCAETLRSEGFAGRIVMVTREAYLPYDRIKVSKLTAHTDIAKLQVRSQEYYDNARIEIRRGVEATGLDVSKKAVQLSDGTRLHYQSLFLATGSRARVPDVPGKDLANVFTVREYKDAMDIIAALGPDKDKHVVVLGLSFIGLEIGAACATNAGSVTIVGTDSAPLAQVFGQEIGESLQKLFEGKGVKFHFKKSISECKGEGRVESVVLTDGVSLPADVVIFGVGTTLYTDFLRDSGLVLQPNGAVVVDERLETSAKGVYAGGDIASAPVFAHDNERMSIGHVGLAQYHGRHAALNILHKKSPLRVVPYFWTMLFGKSIRYAGCGRPASSLVDGDVAALQFVVFFLDAQDRVIAVASCGRDPVVSQFAELLHAGRTLRRDDLAADKYAWTKTIGVKA